MTASTRLVAAAAAIPILLSAAAQADSISVESFSAAIAVGGTTSGPRTVEISAGASSGLVDIYLLADTTGSMRGALNAVSGAARSIISNIAPLADLQGGVGEYKDRTDGFIIRDNVGEDTVHTRSENNFVGRLSPDPDELVSAIHQWSATGGGDTPEGNLIGLLDVASRTRWRDESERLVVWFGDALGHEDDADYPTRQEVIDALVENDVTVLAFGVTSGANNFDGNGQATDITEGTGGTFQSGVSPSAVQDAIEAELVTAIQTYSNVTLDIMNSNPGLQTAARPLEFTGEFDRSEDQSFTFDIDYQGLSPGLYEYQIHALVDGSRVATGFDSICVGDADCAPPPPPPPPPPPRGVNEPGTFAMAGLALIGPLGARSRRR